MFTYKKMWGRDNKPICPYHDNVADDAGASCQLSFSLCLVDFGVILSEEVEVEAHPRQEVFGLSHIHPEPLQLHAVELSIAGHEREHFFFYACGPQLKIQKTTHI